MAVILNDRIYGNIDAKPEDEKIKQKVDDMINVPAHDGRYLKKTIPSQRYNDKDGGVQLMPGQFVPQEVIDRFNINPNYFIHVDSVNAKSSFDFAHDKKGKFSVGIIRDMNGRGDVLLSSVIAKALKYKYGDDVKVVYCVKPGYEDILRYNPYIDKVVTNKNKMKNVDISICVNDLEFRTELQMFEEEDRILKNRATIYLEQMGLHLENKTPTYVVTKEEREWAISQLESLGYDLNGVIIGIQLEGSNVTRTYSKMVNVGEQLLEKGYQVLILDEQISNGIWKYNHRQVGALVEQMTVTVTPNSYFYHLAGALKKRAVAIFGSCDGEIWVQDYEKVTACQISCPKGRGTKCWWELRCLEGGNLRTKEKTHAPPCLDNIQPDMVVKEVEKQITDYKKILVVVLAFNFSHLTKQMVDSVRSFHEYDIVVLDNNSKDDTVEWCKMNNIEVQTNVEPVHSAWNRALKLTKDRGYDYCLLCNNDSILSSTYVDTLVEVAERRCAYAVTGNVVNKKDGNEVNFVGKTKELEISQSIMVPGDYSALLISRECIDKVGGFKYFAQRYQADEDHLLRLRLVDNTLIKTYATTFFHKHGAVWKNTMSRENRDKEWNQGLRNFIKEWKINPYKDRKLLNSIQYIRDVNKDWKDKIYRELKINEKKT